MIILLSNYFNLLGIFEIYASLQVVNCRYGQTTLREYKTYLCPKNKFLIRKLKNNRRLLLRIIMLKICLFMNISQS